MSLVLKAEHIRKSFGNAEVLKDINLSVEKGSVVSILGPSGTGKTTFLRCLNYVEIVDAETSIPMTEAVPGKSRISAAIWYGQTRLIDNVRI